jgi:hypothetical protein
MSQFLLPALAAFGGTAAALAVLGWLAKALITQWLTRALDVNRVQLGKEVSIEIERLRADLAGAGKDREILFSAFHERRAKAITAIYAHLSDARAHNSTLAAALERVGFEGQEKRAKAAGDSLRRMINIVETRRLYLPDEVVDQLRELLTMLSFPSLRYQWYSRGKSSKEEVESALQHWNAMQGDFEKRYRRVERELRRLIGDPAAAGSAVAEVSKTALPGADHGNTTRTS